MIAGKVMVVVMRLVTAVVLDVKEQGEGRVAEKGATNGWVDEEECGMQRYRMGRDGITSNWL